MKARNYLADKGLAKRDGRGRFSREALAELKRAIDEGIKFEDYGSDYVRKPVENVTAPKVVVRKVAATLAKNVQIRSEKTMYGIDRIANGKDLVITFDSCAGCNKSISYCSCSSGPKLPNFMGGGVGMLSKPNDK